MNFLIFTIIPGIVSFFVMMKEKAMIPEGQVDESPLSRNMLWFVFILSLLAPLITQTIFYYGWKKRLPKKAKKANQLGWLAILIWIGGYVVFYILL